MTEILKKKNKIASYLAPTGKAHLPSRLGPAHRVLSLLPRGSKQHGGGDDARRGATSTPSNPWASSRPLFTPREPLWSPLSIPPLPVVARFLFLAKSREPEVY